MKRLNSSLIKITSVVSTALFLSLAHGAATDENYINSQTKPSERFNSLFDDYANQNLDIDNLDLIMIIKMLEFFDLMQYDDFKTYLSDDRLGELLENLILNQHLISNNLKTDKEFNDFLSKFSIVITKDDVIDHFQPKNQTNDLQLQERDYLSRKRIFIQLRKAEDMATNDNAENRALEFFTSLNNSPKSGYNEKKEKPSVTAIITNGLFTEASVDVSAEQGNEHLTPNKLHDIKGASIVIGRSNEQLIEPFKKDWKIVYTLDAALNSISENKLLFVCNGRYSPEKLMSLAHKFIYDKVGSNADSQYFLAIDHTKMHTKPTVDKGIVETISEESTIDNDSPPSISSATNESVDSEKPIDLPQSIELSEMAELTDLTKSNEPIELTNPMELIELNEPIELTNPMELIKLNEPAEPIYSMEPIKLNEQLELTILNITNGIPFPTLVHKSLNGIHKSCLNSLNELTQDCQNSSTISKDLNYFALNYLMEKAEQSTKPNAEDERTEYTDLTDKMKLINHHYASIGNLVPSLSSSKSELYYKTGDTSDDSHVVKELNSKINQWANNDSNQKGKTVTNANYEILEGSVKPIAGYKSFSYKNGRSCSSGKPAIKTFPNVDAIFNAISNRSVT